METTQRIKAEVDTTGSDDSADVGPRGGSAALRALGVRVKRSRSQDASETQEETQHSEKVQRTFWCPHCDYYSTHKGHYNSHLTTHTGEKPYTCPECHMGFNRKGNLVRHKMSHSQEKQLGCPECPERFKTKYSLNRHIFFKHLEEEKPFACETCGKRLSRLDSLTRHQRVHAGNRARRYSCSMCLRTFAYRHVAKRHEKNMHGLQASSSTHDGKAAATPGEEENA
ncbi:uncharacterized protein LOC144179755 [Haemaphysalis longicornis]